MLFLCTLCCAVLKISRDLGFDKHHDLMLIGCLSCAHGLLHHDFEWACVSGVDCMTGSAFLINEAWLSPTACMTACQRPGTHSCFSLCFLSYLTNAASSSTPLLTTGCASLITPSPLPSSPARLWLPQLRYCAAGHIHRMPRRDGLCFLCPTYPELKTANCAHIGMHKNVVEMQKSLWSSYDVLHICT